MRRNLLLVVLAFSLVLFFSKFGFATNDYYLDDVNLEIGPCEATGGGTVRINIMVNQDSPIVAYVCPLIFSGTSNPKLDTILTGGLANANPPAFFNSIVVTLPVPPWGTKIVNPYGTVTQEHNLFSSLAITEGAVPPLTAGLFAEMWITVDGPGTLCIDTLTFPPGVPASMNAQSGEVAITWGGPYCFDVVRGTEVAPVVTCPDYLEYFVNDVIPINISAVDGGGTPIQGIFLVGVNPPCGDGDFDHTNAPSPWVYTWDTEGCDEGNYTLTFGVYDACETTYCETDVKLIATVGFIKIGNTLTDIDGGGVDPCDLVKVPVLLKANTSFGAFDLYIEFDPTLLYFKGVERGPGLPEGWEVFTYRQLPCPSCGCCKYKLQLFGLYDIKDKHQGEPIEITEDYVVLAYLNFQVACDENLRGYDLNICFEFDDGECTENTFSDVSGYVLYVSDNPDFFNYDDCDTQFHGLNIVMNKMHFDLFAPPGTLNPDGRACGGVLVRGLGEKVRGDINLNLLAYEPADLVLFSSYFIWGPDVFVLDAAVQIANTDINADGHPLSLSDFILMIRIMLNDATAIPKPTPGSDLATIYVNKGSETKVSSSSALGAVLFTFKGEGTVSSDLKFEQGVVEGNLKVLVYMSTGTGVSGELFTVSGDVTLDKVEAVDNFGRPVKTTVVNKSIPTAFALHPNYPNPFNPVTNLSFALPVDSKVSLKIYNVAGQLVRTLVNETLPAGNHTITWNGTNSNGEKVASGIYFYKLNAGEFSKTMKMVMTK